MAQPRTNSREARQRAKKRRAIQTKIDERKDRIDSEKTEIARMRAELRSMR